MTGGLGRGATRRLGGEMEDDESLERQRQSIAAEVEALEDATGVTKQNELKKKASAFHESMSQLKEQRLGLLKQRAHLTQEMEKRGFSVRDAEEASTSYSSADASKRKFAAEVWSLQVPAS